MTATLPAGSGRAPEPAIFRDHDRPPAGAVAAIGNFDGVHLGHRRLVEIAGADARAAGGPSAVLTFEPHPRDFFRPDEPAFRLTPEPLKLKILGRLGVPVVVVRRFDAALAGTSASDFVAAVLAGELALSEVVVGENFHFGRGREGTPDSLRRLAAQVGLKARIEPPVSLDGEPISSSRVRDAVAGGDITLANRLLGYRWLVSGEVRHGDKRGRDLGFPTANLQLGPGCRLAHGIYAVRVATAPGEIHEGVASFGRRPTFDDGVPLLETFIFDFAGDLYGRTIEVEFVGWIRGEKRFASGEELAAEMRRDADRARTLLAEAGSYTSFLG